MPARIYALAKELNVDSKDLVDLVKKVGITGKGSALASLSDEETQKVRDHLTGAAAPAAAAAPPAVALGAVRDAVPLERKPIAIKVGRSGGPRGSEAPVAAPAKVELPPAEPMLAEPAETEAISRSGPRFQKKRLGEPHWPESWSLLRSSGPDPTRRYGQWWRQNAITRSPSRQR